MRGLIQKPRLRNAWPGKDPALLRASIRDDMVRRRSLGWQIPVDQTTNAPLQDAMAAASQADECRILPGEKLRVPVWLMPSSGRLHLLLRDWKPASLRWPRALPPFPARHAIRSFRSERHPPQKQCQDLAPCLPEFR